MRSMLNPNNDFKVELESPNMIDTWPNIFFKVPGVSLYKRLLYTMVMTLGKEIIFGVMMFVKEKECFIHH